MSGAVSQCDSRPFFYFTTTLLHVVVFLFLIHNLNKFDFFVFDFLADIVKL
jgi:hypothetical protein